MGRRFDGRARVNPGPRPCIVAAPVFVSNNGEETQDCNQQDQIPEEHLFEGCMVHRRC